MPPNVGAGWSWAVTPCGECSVQGVCVSVCVRSSLVGCQSVKVRKGQSRAGKCNQGRKIIIFPFDGFLYPAVLCSLTPASWVHMASAVVLPLGNKSGLSSCSFWCPQLSPHLEGQRREVWREESAEELHRKEPSST